jgi:hypothetical protein
MEKMRTAGGKRTFVNQVDPTQIKDPSISIIQIVGAIAGRDIDYNSLSNGPEARRFFETCPHWVAAQRDIASARLNMRMALVAAAATTLACIYFWQVHTSRNASQEAKDSPRVCLFNGKPYSIGSVLIEDTTAFHIECIADMQRDIPAWRPARS